MTTDLLDACRAAAARFGTPLYLYDLERLHRDAQAVARAFPDPWLRLYSLKANGLPALVRELLPHGFGATAVSGGELALAARAGIERGRTALEGIGKSPADLRVAARLAAAGTPLLWVSLESAEEAAALAELAGRLPRQRGADPIRVDVLVRVNPQVQPETHGGLAVGSADSKFGVLPEELGEVVEAGGGPDGPLRWRGIHVHVGSQLGAVDAWRSAFRLGLRLLALQRATLPDLDTLDAGSGFPVDFGEAGSVPGVELFAREAAVELAAVAAESRPARLAVEPGRSVVAGSGWLVARVLHVRDRGAAVPLAAAGPLALVGPPGTTTGPGDAADRSRRMVVLDAGMTELIRPALYGAEHPMVALTSMGQPVTQDDSAAGTVWPLVRVDGPVCESTDRLGEARLPPLQRGDLVAIGVVGAYGSSMSSTYNGRPRAPEVAWAPAGISLLRRRGRAGF
ncbi:MAG: diaminopimelate decarboxylase [Chloroflexota bacterium]|nr:diaminopimelate decarboxylase [Chloroflexota bacterium]